MGICLYGNGFFFKLFVGVFIIEGLPDVLDFSVGQHTVRTIK